MELVVCRWSLLRKVRLAIDGDTGPVKFKESRTQCLPEEGSSSDVNLGLQLPTLSLPSRALMEEQKEALLPRQLLPHLITSGDRDHSRDKDHSQDRDLSRDGDRNSRTFVYMAPQGPATKLDGLDGHEKLVERVSQVLMNVKELDKEINKEEDMGESEDGGESLDEDMSLTQFQTAAMIQALARRDTPKSSSSLKKGRVDLAKDP
ncbi:hypothetical protein J5N97_006428 [Dioscorea zingiberensis]|uniref:Uncharacterized protein n=1 Tax=Dioscorea zingiberensis TaxID=325984 RepID=A0A9D5DD29_9LILI|nr:hypothetical protein J5N97_006428 [Dioscorea zingiberensis]